MTGKQILSIPICKYCGMEADYGTVCQSCKKTLARKKKYAKTK